MNLCFRSTALALSLLAVPQLLTAAPDDVVVVPAPPTPAELEALEAAQVSSLPKINAAADQVTKDWDAQVAKSEEATSLLRGFLSAAAVTVTAQVQTPAASRETKTEPKSETPAADAPVTKITCDGGMFFDTQQGVIVYLKNVVVSDPRFTLTAGDEVKVFLKKKAEEPKKDDKKDKPSGENKTPEDPNHASPDKNKDAKGEKGKDAKKDELLGGASQFGDIDRMIATGGVVVTRVDPQNGKIEARGATASYDATNQIAILKGGYPQISKPDATIRAKREDTWIRVPINGTVTFGTGPWDTILTGIQDKLKANDKDKKQN